ncbi:MAG TPA: hypothetical protein VLW55_05225, partial [Burkholderiaceae bacterium]|nr:hypothetical protein [Burkholderiaceae bacterium]
SERDLRGLLNSVAGEAGATVLERASSEFGVRDLPGSSGLSVVDSEDVCLICANVNAVRRRWLQALRPALQAGQSAWLALPSCAEHVIAAAAVGDTGVTRAAAEHAAEIALLILHRRLPPFTPAIATELERFAVRRMRRRGRKGASTRSNPRPPRRQSVRCAACERLAIARDAASARLLDALASSAGQQAKYANLCLCLRHFASVYLLADRGTTRTFLTNVQRGCLALARDRLNTNVTGDASAANASLIGALTRLGCHLSGGGAE